MDLPNALLIFFILHVLVYPSSNGYNSFMDRDTDSIGGVKKPLPVEKQLFYVTVVIDLTALLLSMLIGAKVALGVALYIIASRLYSYRGVRLKQYPVIGFLTVVLCQGTLVYGIVSMSVHSDVVLRDVYFPALITALLIGGTYPLTQVYQHEQDRRDGITTLSYLLGVKGTFIFCGIVLFVALLLLTIFFISTGQPYSIWVYLIATFPVAVYLSRWFFKVRRNGASASFENLMKMNYLAAICSSLAFVAILILNNR